MEIALYQDHLFLPFWENPQNPEYLFEPSMINWVIKGRNGSIAHCKLKDHYMMPVIQGIQTIDIPEVMAHISLAVDQKGKRLKEPMRIWIQFSTSPEEFSDGLPVVMRDEDLQVVHIWGSNNGTYNPLQLHQ